MISVNMKSGTMNVVFVTIFSNYLILIKNSLLIYNVLK